MDRGDCAQIIANPLNEFYEFDSGDVGIVLRNDKHQILKVAAIPMPNGMSVALVEALGFQKSVELARAAMGEVFLVKGDAQDVV